VAAEAARMVPVHVSLFWAELPRPIIVAHRSGNSQSAIERATEIGVDVLEADIWLHQGRLEVRHSKTAGPLPVLWDRWSLGRLPDRPFELADLLASIRPGMPVMLDVKGINPRLPRMVIDVVRESRSDAPVTVCSQNWAMLERFRGVPQFHLVHSIGNRRQLHGAWRVLQREGFDVVSIHARMLNAELVARLKTHVSAVITWPINTSTLLDHVIDMGVDGITSDNFALMESHLRQRRSS
jgi:glycerophosphoryl diester phosphodiesterase